MPVSNIEVTVPKKKTYELLPKDVYQCEVIELEETQKPAYNNPSELEDKIVFTFAVIEEGKYYGRRLWKDVNPKLSKYKGGSILYKILVALNDGKSFTDEEIANPMNVASPEKLNELVGKQIRLTVDQKEKETKPGEFKNIIDSYLPVKEELDSFDEEKVEKEEDDSDNDSDEELNVADIDFQ